MADQATQNDLPQEQLLASFREFSEAHFQECLQRWEAQHREVLSGFRDLLTRCRQQLAALPAEPAHLDHMWKELGQTALQVKEWLQGWLMRRNCP